jgi:hypothetical protein
MKITKSQLKRIIKEELEKSLKEYAQAEQAPATEDEDQDPRLVDRMKTLYPIVIEKRPDFKHHRDPVGLFKQAYEAEPQKGMADVHQIIRKMEELSQEPFS